MNKLSELYFKGFLKGNFKHGYSLEQFNKTLEAIYHSKIKDGYRLESKYPFSKDLRPQAYDYDESMLDILFDSGVPNLIKESLGYNLYLAHMQIRIADPFPPGQEKRSYMEWHRDTHFYNDELHGNAPPVYKLIYYPKFNDDENSLMVAQSTHLRILPNRQQDYQQLRNSKIITMGTSTDEYLFFNTSMFHSTLPAHQNGTMRVIYNFCLENQLSKYSEQNKLHVLYKKKLYLGANL